MGDDSKLGTFLKTFLARTEDLELEFYDVLIAVSVRLVREEAEANSSEILRTLEDAGLTSADDSLMKPGVVSLPVVSGKIHPKRIHALTSLALVESVKVVTLSRPLTEVGCDE